MGCRIQIKTFMNFEGKAEVYIGFEDDDTGTSILALKEEAKNSHLNTFAGSQLYAYNKNLERHSKANLKEGSIVVPVEALSRSANKFLHKLSGYIKVEDYYYNDEELRLLIHGLHDVQPYLRDNSKDNLVRHLQWHNINYKTSAVTPAEDSPEPPYETWGTW